MDLDFNKEQEMLRKSVAEFLVVPDFGELDIIKHNLL